MICLPKQFSDMLLSKIKDGTITPDKLSTMSSADREAMLKDVVGEENARPVNALIESKLAAQDALEQKWLAANKANGLEDLTDSQKNQLLKLQQSRLITAVRGLAGLKPALVTDMVTRINKLSDILSPKNEDAFYESLAAKSLGSDRVTVEQANHIVELAHTAQAAKEAINPSDPIGSDARLKYGMAKVGLENHVAELKAGNKSSIGSKILTSFNVVRSIKASADISSMFYQEGKAVFSNPIIWTQNALKTFGDLGKAFGNQDVLDATKADILSRPNALNGLYEKEHLAISNMEEALPTRVQEKIPVLGRILKATDESYMAMQYRIRADVFDKMVDIAQKTGGSTRGIGIAVNSLTGRGSLDLPGINLEPAANALNTFVYPPRLLMSNIDTLTGGVLHYGEMDSFARKQMAYNSIKTIAGMASIMAIANFLKPGSATTNSVSSNFGKIKVGDIAFDFSAGLGSAVVLASRLLKSETASATTGKITPLNTGKFGSETKMDVVQDYITGRGTGVGDLIFNWLKGSDYAGNKPASVKSLISDFEPYVASDITEALQTPNGKGATLLAVILGSELGVFPTSELPAAKKK